MIYWLAEQSTEFLLSERVQAEGSSCIAQLLLVLTKQH